jgi:hypothetical protein
MDHALAKGMIVARNPSQNQTSRKLFFNTALTNLNYSQFGV